MVLVLASEKAGSGIQLRTCFRKSALPDSRQCKMSPYDEGPHGDILTWPESF